ncbi:hypothetical protein BC831DRAFT_482366, partial [Entophlyctis helioformis]
MDIQQLQQMQQMQQQQQQVQQQQQQQQPAQQDALEYSLVAAGAGVMPHHIMKVPSAKFDITSLKRPVKMQRVDPYKLRLEKYKEEAERQGRVWVDRNAPVAAAGASGTGVGGVLGVKSISSGIDHSKVAPFGNAQKSKQNLFKKKTKTYFLGRDSEDAGNGGDGSGPSIDGTSFIPSVNSRIGDPDRHPWVLQDDDGQHYTGSLEGSQNSNYVLFVLSDNGFKIIPASKWYKFVPKANYRTLTADEAEAKMSVKSTRTFARTSDRWMMAKGKSGKSGDADEDEKKPSLMQRLRKKTIDDDTEGRSSTKSARRPKREDEQDIGFDYEEEFADDEEVNLGIEDADEAKEASRRVYGRAGSKAQFDDDEFDEMGTETKPTGKAAKRLAKSIVKHEQNDAYDGLDDDNPYVSDVDDDDEDEEMDDASKVEIKQEFMQPGSGAPANIKREAMDPIKKLKREAVGSSGLKSSQQRIGSPSAASLSGRVASPNVPRPQSPATRTADTTGRDSPDAHTLSKSASIPKTGKPSAAGSGSSSPISPNTPLSSSQPPSSDAAKRKRTATGEDATDASASADKRQRQQSPPPPPSAADVVAREIRTQRLKARSGKPGSGTPTGAGGSVRAASPINRASSPLASGSAISPPTAGSGTPGSSTPASASSASGNGRLLVEDDILRAVFAIQRDNPTGAVTVKDILAHLKDVIKGNPAANKDLLRLFMRSLLIHDKATSTVKVKDQYLSLRESLLG